MSTNEYPNNFIYEKKKINIDVKIVLKILIQKMF